LLGKNCYMVLDTFTKGFLIKFSLFQFSATRITFLPHQHYGNSQFLSRGPKRILCLLLFVGENRG